MIVETFYFLKLTIIKTISTIMVQKKFNNVQRT